MNFETTIIIRRYSPIIIARQNRDFVGTCDDGDNNPIDSHIDGQGFQVKIRHLVQLIYNSQKTKRGLDEAIELDQHGPALLKKVGPVLGSTNSFQDRQRFDWLVGHLVKLHKE